jgi:hypothetical protein
MNEAVLEAAMAEAKRFIRMARIASSALKQDTYYGGKETAAAKRASMDLTRALADVRRPR